MANPIKPTIKSELAPIIMILAAIVLSFYFYAHFPEQVPTHWNFAGVPDGWSGRGFAAFFLPVLLIGMYLLFLVVPYLDPKRERYVQFRRAYHVFKAAIMLVLTGIFLVTGLNGIGRETRVDLWVPLAVGALFIILGNYMGKLKPNWFIGIRTPWTLSSEEVWNKTHRFGGKIFMASGLGMALMYFLPLAWRLPAFILLMAAILLGTVGYSYWAFVQERRKKRGQ